MAQLGLLLCGVYQPCDRKAREVKSKLLSWLDIMVSSPPPGWLLDLRCVAVGQNLKPVVCVVCLTTPVCVSLWLPFQHEGRVLI